MNKVTVYVCKCVFHHNMNQLSESSRSQLLSSLQLCQQGTGRASLRGGFLGKQEHGATVYGFCNAIPLDAGVLSTVARAECLIKQLP